MPRKTALNLAFEALTLAAECGGELDHGIYVEAKHKLESMLQAVVAYGAKMDAEKRPPEGDDYNQLLAILEIHAGVTVDGWTEIIYDGQRWQFSADDLAEWDENSQSFHFLTFHGLDQPTVETVCRFIDQL
jgi:hypothetical protein